MKEYINDTIKYYNDNCENFKSKWDNYLFDIPNTFAEYLKDDAYVLDLGCGTGRDSLYFKEKGFKVKCIDGSVNMCKIASEALGQEVENKNYLDIDYKDLFDGVFACASLLHLKDEDLKIVLKKVYDSLKFNGIMYASFKYGNDERFEDGRFFNDMTLDKFNRLMNETECNFEIIKAWNTSQYGTDSEFLNLLLKKK
ncbi:MAG: class I SAM-dependent methyltransferase [Bacilli bacterium]|nr:class I SAM-dependent methyltransferase [Bacilli bacterium]